MSWCAGELEGLRSEVESFFDQVLDIYRPASASSDAYGGYGEGAFSLVQANVPCEIYPGIAHVVDLLDQGQLVDTQLYTITVAVGTDIQKGDQVVVGDLRLSVNVVFWPESQAMQLRFVADKEILSG